MGGSHELTLKEVHATLGLLLFRIEKTGAVTATSDQPNACIVGIPGKYFEVVYSPDDNWGHSKLRLRLVHITDILPLELGLMEGQKRLCQIREALERLSVSLRLGKKWQPYGRIVWCDPDKGRYTIFYTIFDGNVFRKHVGRPHGFAALGAKDLQQNGFVLG